MRLHVASFRYVITCVTSGPRYSYVGDLSSVTTISEATKHRGSLSALSATSSAPETEYLVAEVGPSPTSVARAYHSRISAKKLSECIQMQNRIPLTLSATAVVATFAAAT